MADKHQQLGPYRLKRRLDQGGFGEVWLAERRGPGGFVKRVCIKRVLPAHEGDAQVRAAFLNEARVLAQLRHPCIVGVDELGETKDGTLYLVMDYIEGVNLAALLRAQPAKRLDPRLAAYVGSQVADALAYAHRSDPGTGRPALVHRDVTPKNIVLNQFGKVFVIDFGVSKALEATGARTDPGEQAGKYPYMAPEQLLGMEIDARVDLFSLGVLLWEAVCGWRPYEDEALGKKPDARARDAWVMGRIERNQRRKIEDVGVGDLPTELASLINSLLQPVGARSASAEQLHGELTTIAQSVGAKQLAPLVCRLEPLVPPTLEERPGIGREENGNDDDSADEVAEDEWFATPLTQGEHGGTAALPGAARPHAHAEPVPAGPDESTRTAAYGADLESAALPTVLDAQPIDPSAFGPGGTLVLPEEPRRVAATALMQGTPSAALPREPTRRTNRWIWIAVAAACAVVLAILLGGAAALLAAGEAEPHDAPPAEDR